jgi:adenylate cyclase
VDPALVDYLMERPDELRLEGERREISVCFTDLVDFTALSERLKEETVPLLNEFMGEMVPVIRARNGYVNKFLGDGIMFFFGAPRRNEQHAIDAVVTALSMQRALEQFNREEHRLQLPDLAMRVGISTGMMVVGDAGSHDASDYTVLGDAVNLGARLESANKLTGTRILMSGRTAELLDGQFLLRPIGRLQVAGKSEGVMTFEALAASADADERQKQFATMTAAMVDAFIAGKFPEALTAAAALEQEFGPSKLTRLYRGQCDEQIANPDTAVWTGTIVFRDK